MFKEFFFLLLLGHIIGDFYFQTHRMSENKSKSLKWVFIHCICYCCGMYIAALPIISKDIVKYIFIAGILHFLIDIVKYIVVTKMMWVERKLKIQERNIFVADQLLHLFCLIMIAYWIVESGLDINELQWAERFFDVLGVSEQKIGTWLLALLIIHKPANILIQKLLLIYKPKDKNEESGTGNNTGRFIGTVERIIMLIFLSIGQYSAMGLVLTAKSIARYDRISKEKDFAEYYLLGTLISTVIVIVISFII